jgi:hypothetical protein
VIYEESKRQRELEKIKELSSLEEILSYVEHTEKSERVIICV